LYHTFVNPVLYFLVLMKLILLMKWKLIIRRVFEILNVSVVDMSSFVVPVDPSALEVVLKPMQIRTFQVNLK